MIKALKEKIPIHFLCKYFSVNRSSFYLYLNYKNTGSFQTKSEICSQIRVIFKDSKNTYGSPRVHQSLKELGVQISENTVAKYMREMGLDARLKKKYRIVTTDSNHSFPIADRIFKTEVVENFSNKQVLAGDITYLKLGSDFLYLAIIMDIQTRKIVGWSMSSSLSSEVVIKALDGAKYCIKSDTQVIFHSDRGSQYASEVFREVLNENFIIQSMSRKGNCYDNAYVESWFKSLKTECIYRSKYSTQEELTALVFEYIEVWYNKKRKHSALDYLSPEQYELKQLSA